MILAAGYGTRLRPLTDRLPKPLVPVGDRPALAHMLDILRGAGVSRTVVNAHFGVDAIASFVERDGACLLSHEPELLGTAGGLAAAVDLIGEGPVIAWNGDILAPIDLRAVAARHIADRSEATLVVQPLPAGEGNVGVDAGGRIVRIRDRRAPGSREAAGGYFVGVHVLGERIRKRLPARGCVVGDVYVPALEEGVKLASFRWDGPYVEIGDIAFYIDANLAWLVREGVPSWVGPGATVVEGITLDRSVIGIGAEVTGSGALERCVVWPGARVEAPLADAVVLPGAVVPRPHAKGNAHP
jgi:mannose-1-phosphate guanylyltransferase